MKKRIFVSLLMVLVLIMSFGIILTAQASEISEIYVYQDESAITTFTLKDETQYDCEEVNMETGETIKLSGVYLKEENFITFYFSGEILLKAEIGENNALVKIETEEEKDLNVIKEVEEYSAKITGYIISAVLGILGTLGVYVLSRKELKKLLKNVLTAIGLLKTSKDENEGEIKTIISNAKILIASLENFKSEMLEENKKEFETLKNEIYMIACGSRELVSNGTAMKISDTIKK